VKIVYFSIIALLVMSCSPFGLNTMGYEIKETPLDEAWKLVSSYKYVADEYNYWKSPREFFDSGFGDCEDFSAALVYLLGPEASMVIYDRGDCLHCIVEYKGEYIEPQKYGKRYTRIFELSRFDYYEAMRRTTELGTKSL